MPAYFSNNLSCQRLRGISVWWFWRSLAGDSPLAGLWSVSLFGIYTGAGSYLHIPGLRVCVRLAEQGTRVDLDIWLREAECPGKFSAFCVVFK